MPFKDNKREGGNEATWMPRNFIARWRGWDFDFWGIKKRKYKMKKW